MARVSGLGHVGLHVKDIKRSVEFYRDVLGLQITDSNEERGMYFFSARPEEEHHELLLAPGREGEPKLLQQLSFTVDSLAELKSFSKVFRDRQVPIAETVSHGISLSIYFYDPDGNRLEVYWPTGKKAHQPHKVPIDLELPEEELLASLERTEPALVR